MNLDLIIFLILAIFVILCFTVFALLSYSGLFYEPVVSTGETPWVKNATIAYKFIRGPYNGNDVGSTFTEVTSIAPLAPPAGLFYDDPHVKAPNSLRSVVGCIVKENVGEDDEISNVTEEELALLTEKGFKFFRLPFVEKAVFTDFVYTTPFSLWLAHGRVYSRLQHYIQDRKLCAYPFVEIYKDCKVLYAAPLSKQEDFFVDECRIDEDVQSDVTKIDQMNFPTKDKATHRSDSETSESGSSSFEEIDNGMLLQSSSTVVNSEKKDN